MLIPVQSYCSPNTCHLCLDLCCVSAFDPLHEVHLIIQRIIEYVVVQACRAAAPANVESFLLACHCIKTPGLTFSSDNSAGNASKVSVDIVHFGAFAFVAGLKLSVPFICVCLMLQKDILTPESEDLLSTDDNIYGTQDSKYKNECRKQWEGIHISLCFPGAHVSLHSCQPSPV